MQPALYKRIGSANGALNHSCFAHLLVRVFLSHRTLTPLVRVIARVAIINQSAPSVPILLTFLLLIPFAYHCTTFSFEHFSFSLATTLVIILFLSGPVLPCRRCRFPSTSIVVYLCNLLRYLVLPIRMCTPSRPCHVHAYLPSPSIGSNPR